LSESENEKIVRKAYELLLRKDFDSLTDMFTDDFIWVGASNTEWDIEKFRRYSARDSNVFPDANYDIKRVIAKGSTVVAEYLWTGTHKEEAYGIPATNKKIEVPFVDIFDFIDGKIKLWKTYCNVELYKKQMTE
jgi:steroid delta-isomerase-like uncharacterized protein